jgi:hypothetical protein
MGGMTMRYAHPTAVPLSKALVSLQWTGDRIPVFTQGIRGDTYPQTWAKDDEIYVGTGDPNWVEVDGKIVNGRIPERPELDDYIFRRVSGHVIEKITGAPEKFDVERINDLPGQTGWGGSGPKPSGMISVNGVLYYAAQNYMGWKPPRYGIDSQHGSDASILRSDDCGKTWTPDLDDMLSVYYKENYTIGPPHHEAWKLPPEDRASIGAWKPMFPGSWFGGPSFVQYGKDNGDAADNYVYAISADHWDNGSELRLGRAPNNAVQDRDKWEFAIPDNVGGVSWTSELYRSLPVLAIDRHVGLPEMVYLSGEGKYLLLTWGLHKDFRASTGAELTVLEADKPWGPFYLVYYEWMWYSREGGHYCPRVPLKWFDQDKLTGYMLYSGNWETQIPYYMPQTRPFRIVRA